MMKSELIVLRTFSQSPLYPKGERKDPMGGQIVKKDPVDLKEPRARKEDMECLCVHVRGHTCVVASMARGHCINTYQPMTINTC